MDPKAETARVVAALREELSPEARKRAIELPECSDEAADHSDFDQQLWQDAEERSLQHAIKRPLKHLRSEHDTLQLRVSKYKERILQHADYLKPMMIWTWRAWVTAGRLTQYLWDGPHSTGKRVMYNGKQQQLHEWCLVVVLDHEQLSLRLQKWDHESEWRESKQNPEIKLLPWDDRHLWNVPRGNWQRYWQVALELNPRPISAIVALSAYTFMHHGGQKPSCLMH